MKSAVALSFLHALDSAGHQAACQSLPSCCAHPVQVAERVNAAYLWILAPNEHEKGLVRRKNLETREEEDILLADFYEDIRNHEDSGQEDDPYSDFMASQDQAEATGSGIDDVSSGQKGAAGSAENLGAGPDTNSRNGSSSDSLLHSAGDQTA